MIRHISPSLKLLIALLQTFLFYYVTLIFPCTYKRDLEHLANYALEICNPRARGRSMNANHRDIMEQYCRQHITSDKFSPDKSVVYPRKNCTLMSEIIIMVRRGHVNLNEFSKSTRVPAILLVYQIICKQTSKFIIRQLITHQL